MTQNMFGEEVGRGEDAAYRGPAGQIVIEVVVASVV